MRIHEFHINGFGRFADHDAGPFRSPVTVFFGPNEAGKSTLLAFLRTILFGFPRRLGSQHYPPLAGGIHGGSVTLEGRDGRQYLVRRTQGAGRGPVEVSTISGERQDESVLGQLLGSHTQDVFNSIFAFTLDELHSEDLMRDSSVNSQLYSTGMGAASLPGAIDELDQLRNRIFLNRGRTQEIYHASKKLEDIESKLREVDNNSSRYSQLQTRLGQIDAAVDDLSSCRSRIQSELSRQTVLSNAWESWNDLVSAERELESLPVIENFPVGGARRLEALEERVRTAREERDSATHQAEVAKAGLGDAVENIGILGEFEAIRKIERGRNAFDQSVHDLPEREVELGNDRKMLSEIMDELGSDWNEARLESFDMSLNVRQDIQRIQNEIQTAEEKVERASADSRNADVALEEAEAALAYHKRNLDDAEHPQLNTSQINQRRADIRTARSTLDEFARANERVADFEPLLEGAPANEAGASRPKGLGAISTIISIVGAGLIIGSLILGGPSAVVGVVAGILLIAMVGIILYLNRPAFVSNSASPSTEVEVERKESLYADVDRGKARLETHAEKLGIETVDSASLNSLESDLDSELLLLTEWDRLNRAIDNSRDVKRQRERRAGQCEQSVESAEEAFEASHKSWCEWLQLQNLRDTFTPETVVELRAKAEQGKDRLSTVREREYRVEAIKTDIHEYAEIVGPLATEFSMAIDRGDDSSVAAAADNLIELYNRVQEDARRRNDAKQAHEAAVDQLRERERRLEGAESEVDALIDAAEASDAEEFRRLHEKAQRRSELEERRRETIDRLQRLIGPGEHLEMLKSSLSKTDAQAIGDEVRALNEERDSVDGQTRELSTERGAVQNQLDALAGERESSELRVQGNVIREQVKEHARQWVTYTVTKNLLNETRMKFERERQPSVLQHAERFFGEVTDWRYSRVVAPFGEQTVTVLDEDGRTKKPSELSRGTREQLFLSLRFGLIRELGEQTEPLPVIVDEVLVNFDPHRAARAARAFMELSITNQVLVFTCHPSTVEAFQEAAVQRSDHHPAPDIISLE